MHDPADTTFTGEPNSRPTTPGVVAGAVIGLAIAALTMTGVFRAAEWRADNVLLPRYCDDAQAAVALVGRILTSPEPAGFGSTRPYVVAAKLMFLIPRAPGEGTDTYLARLREHIEARCP